MAEFNINNHKNDGGEGLFLVFALALLLLFIW